MPLTGASATEAENAIVPETVELSAGAVIVIVGVGGGGGGVLSTLIVTAVAV